MESHPISFELHTAVNSIAHSYVIVSNLPFDLRFSRFSSPFILFPSLNPLRSALTESLLGFHPFHEYDNHRVHPPILLILPGTKIPSGLSESYDMMARIATISSSPWTDVAKEGSEKYGSTIEHGGLAFYTVAVTSTHQYRFLS
ncbi:hypothetical protein BDR04DRAFT_170735 [Suillus decipiens]|nr:hypothetical protein BDR04DRAFT_170735 [Suillus decipiens]